MTAQRPRVLLLFGGRSSEHAVSCVTAAGVLGALDPAAYDVVPVGITRSGAWQLVDPSSKVLDPDALASGHTPEITDSGEHVRLGDTGTQHASTVQSVNPSGVLSELGRIDVVLPLLHGPYGEDGTLQGMLELTGIPYVGCGVAASALGMDKHLSKLAFEAAGLTVGPYEVITDRDWLRDPQAAVQRCEHLQRPVFVKPARAGSSVGITRVDVGDDLVAAIEVARKEDPKVLVEQGITGREIECGVLDGRAATLPRASYPGEIVVDAELQGFYDFDTKYVHTAAAQTVCPADLTAQQTEGIREQAVRAFEAVGGEGLSRVDFFLDTEGNWVINEINTMPGFTPHSMYPQMWAATGVPYTELVDELLQLALHRKTGLR
ncbi:MAG: D-alanine--D-alanine ligase family protein [Galactobacter sp.]|uniref:D-alanine--D-alanine ligase family protein n=1 Tax=Galactobacter sp. TaxID=2676125 RepID=UPI0025BB5955|nr:D-alanine--D-alanine ligase family protein [Galactobacter sp.]